MEFCVNFFWLVNVVKVLFIGFLRNFILLVFFVNNDCVEIDCFCGIIKIDFSFFNLDFMIWFCCCVVVFFLLFWNFLVLFVCVLCVFLFFVNRNLKMFFLVKFVKFFFFFKVDVVMVDIFWIYFLFFIIW